MVNWSLHGMERRSTHRDRWLYRATASIAILTHGIKHRPKICNEATYIILVDGCVSNDNGAWEGSHLDAVNAIAFFIHIYHWRDRTAHPVPKLRALSTPLPCIAAILPLSPNMCTFDHIFARVPYSFDEFTWRCVHNNTTRLASC